MNWSEGVRATRQGANTSFFLNALYRLPIEGVAKFKVDIYSHIKKKKKKKPDLEWVFSLQMIQPKII